MSKSEVKKMNNMAYDAQEKIYKDAPTEQIWYIRLDAMDCEERMGNGSQDELLYRTEEAAVKAFNELAEAGGFTTLTDDRGRMLYINMNRIAMVFLDTRTVYSFVMEKHEPSYRKARIYTTGGLEMHDSIYYADLEKGPSDGEIADAMRFGEMLVLEPAGDDEWAFMLNGKSIVWVDFSDVDIMGCITELK